MTVRGLRRIIVSVAGLDRSLAFYRDAPADQPWGGASRCSPTPTGT